MKIKEKGLTGKAPYIRYTRGDNNGLVGFYKPLTEDDIQFVKETMEEEERQFEIERAQVAARSAFSQSGGGAGEGGRGRERDCGGQSRGKGWGKSNGREKEKGVRTRKTRGGGEAQEGYWTWWCTWCQYSKLYEKGQDGWGWSLKNNDVPFDCKIPYVCCKRYKSDALVIFFRFIQQSTSTLLVLS